MRKYLVALVLTALAAQGAAAASYAAHVPAVAVLGGSLPVDVARAYGANPVWAHSLFRAMSANYNGPLFVVWRQSDGTAHTVYPVAPGGFVNMTDLQAFCSGTSCYYRMICDQIAGTCTANGDNSLTFGRAVSITQASPAVFKTTQSGTAICDAANAANPFYLETTGTLPTGLSPDTIYYIASVSNNHTCATPNPAVTWQASSTVGGAGIATTSAGSGTHTAWIGAVVTYSHLPNGMKIPVYSSTKAQPARNRANTVNLPNPGPGYPISVYGLFGTSTFSTCCGTYGLAETVTKNSSSGADGAMFSMGLVAGTAFEGAPCPGTGPWLGNDLENGVYCSDGGKYTMASTTTAGTVLHITSGQVPAACIVNQTNPALNVPIIDITNPASIPAGTTVTACSSVGNTITVSTNVTVASGDVLYVGNPSPTVTAGFLDAYSSTDGQGNNHALFQQWIGGENAPYAINYANQIPNNRFEGARSYGLTLGEGGDASDAPAQWYEGMGTRGALSAAAIQAIHANLLKTEWQGQTRTGATAYDFTNGSITGGASPSLPAGWSFTRAACSGTGVPSNCYTDALYTDAAGRTPNYFSTNQAVINSNGVMLMTQHANYVGGANAGSDCNQQPTSCLGSSGHTSFTTVSLGTGNNYVLLCNGTGSVTSAAGTAVGSGFGTYNCGSTPQVIHLTTGGTITLTTSTDNTTTPGAFNWIDLQDQSNASGAAGAKNHIYCASTSTPPCTAQTDKLSIGSSSTSKEFTTLESYPNTVVIEHKNIALDNLHLGNKWGALIGTSASAPPILAGVIDVGLGAYSVYAPHSSTNSSNIATAPSVGATHRLGYTFGQMMQSIAYDGLNTLNATNPQTYGGINTAFTHFFDYALPTGVTHYLGFDAWVNGACDCFISKAAFYPYYLGRYELNMKSSAGAPLP